MFHFKNPWVPGGFVGVDLFFAISGYVITRSLVRELDSTSTVSLTQFYSRRFRRIFPAAAVAIAGALLLLSISVGLRMVDAYAAAALLSGTLNLFLTNGSLYNSSFVHLWSLSVEEQFYALWPACFFLLRNKHRRWLAAVAGVVLLGSLTWTVYLTGAGVSWMRTYFAPDTRAAGLLAGCLLGSVGTGGCPKLLVHTWPVPLAVLVWLAVTFNNHDKSMGYGGFALASLASVWLIAVAAENSGNPLGRLLAHPVAQWIGLRSYSVFLWHFTLGQAFHYVGLSLWVALGCALIVADLSYRFVERPFLNIWGREATAREAPVVP